MPWILVLVLFQVLVIFVYFTVRKYRIDKAMNRLRLYYYCDAIGVSVRCLGELKQPIEERFIQAQYDWKMLLYYNINLTRPPYCVGDYSIWQHLEEHLSRPAYQKEEPLHSLLGF